MSQGRYEHEARLGLGEEQEEVVVVGEVERASLVSLSFLLDHKIFSHLQIRTLHRSSSPALRMICPNTKFAHISLNTAHYDLSFAHIGRIALSSIMLQGKGRRQQRKHVKAKQ